MNKSARKRPEHSEHSYSPPSVRAIDPAPEIGGEDLVGLDPGQIKQDQLRALGHLPQSPLQALRRRCLDCCGHQPSEVRNCIAVSCPSWPFRMGSNPWRRAPSAELRESRRQAALTRWAGKVVQKHAA